MASYRDPWVVLGVARSADDAAIKSAYRKLVRLYHPDRNGGDKDKGALFQDIARAHDDIRDEAARERWLTAHESPHAAPGEGFYDTFGAERFTPGGRRRDTPKDIQRTVEITFREAYEGTSKELLVDIDEPCATCGGSGAAPGYKPRTCPTCRGTGEHTVGQVSSPCGACNASGYIVDHPCPVCQGGTVRREVTLKIDIPAGIRDRGTVSMPLPSAGLARPEVVVTVAVAASAVFRRTLKDKDDLLIIVPITYSEACLGTSVRVPTPDRTIQLRIPEGTPTGKAFRIAGKGMPKPQHAPARGDLYARVQVMVPGKLSSAQRKLIAQLGHYDPDDLRVELFADLREP